MTKWFSFKTIHLSDSKTYKYSECEHDCWLISKLSFVSDIKEINEDFSSSLSNPIIPTSSMTNLDSENGRSNFIPKYRYNWLRSIIFLLEEVFVRNKLLFFSENYFPESIHMSSTSDFKIQCFFSLGHRPVPPRKKTESHRTFQDREIWPQINWNRQKTGPRWELI